jgi:hypothetical protein
MHMKVILTVIRHITSIGSQYVDRFARCSVQERAYKYYESATRVLCNDVLIESIDIA